MRLLIVLLGIPLPLVLALTDERRPHPGEKLTPCKYKIPPNTSTDICKDLCEEEGAACQESGACICKKEPTAGMLGGQPIHCTNWSYVDQGECMKICKGEGKDDWRVCWSFTIGNYCTCFLKKQSK